MNRFRPNIVIKTDLNEPFVEDRIFKLTLLSKVHREELINFYITKPCDRCQVPTIAQESAIKDKHNEPTLTLRTFRTGKHLGFEQEKHEKVFFAMNACHDLFDGTVIISKGDAMRSTIS